eukprot:NODE_17493_length_939_cov_13.056650.p1 GENE.NODE_17493_length_939_cov_13.056650~~NODE_17493_length_939_cov_13.056650.p1  ORF type:complete len:204 (+),score=70.88 NODE_17493_length_939_cov_13.056650:111-722(+)
MGGGGGGMDAGFPGGVGMQELSNVLGVGMPGADPQQPAAKRQKTSGPQEVAGPITNLTRDQPLWIQLGDAPTGTLSGLPVDAIALCTDGKTRKALYNSIDAVLQHLMPDAQNAVEYLDDPEWKQFPEVGSAVQVHGNEEVSLQVALCAGNMTWAAGFGSKWTSRHQAAKVALAATLVLHGPDVPDLLQFPDFSEFLLEVETVA